MKALCHLVVGPGAASVQSQIGKATIAYTQYGAFNFSEWFIQTFKIKYLFSCVCLRMRTHACTLTNTHTHTHTHAIVQHPCGGGKQSCGSQLFLYHMGSWSSRHSWQALKEASLPTELSCQPRTPGFYNMSSGDWTQVCVFTQQGLFQRSCPQTHIGFYLNPFQ